MVERRDRRRRDRQRQDDGRRAVARRTIRPCDAPPTPSRARCSATSRDDLRGVQNDTVLRQAAVRADGTPLLRFDPLVSTTSTRAARSRAPPAPAGRHAAALDRGRAGRPRRGAALRAARTTRSSIEEGLKPEDFYRARHRDDLRGRCSRCSRRASRSTSSRVTEHLKAARPARGGRRRSRDRRADRPPSPPSGTCASYAQIVSENALLRRLLDASYEIQAQRLTARGRARASSSTRPSGDPRGRARRPPARTSAPSARSSTRRSRKLAEALRERHAAHGHAVGLRRTSTRSPAASSPAT